MQSTLTSTLAAEIASGDSVRLIDLSRRFNVNTSTIFRWIQKGLPSGHGTRIQLEALRRGKSLITSEKAVERFFGALPKTGETTPATPTRTPSQRERDSARAKQQLHDTYGI